MLAPSSPATRPSFALQLVLSTLALAAPLGAVGWCWLRLEPERPRAERLALFALLIGLTLLHAHYHDYLVDRGNYFPGAHGNTGWQLEAQHRVLTLDPTFQGHPYRFLAFSCLRLFERATGSFETGRTLYRWTFGFLLLASIYALGRTRFSRATALLGVSLFATVVPITYRFYAGQPTDPLSHLSFVLAFLALEWGVFPYLLLSVLIGSLAKESVLAVAVYHALFHRDEPRHWWRTAVLNGGGLVLAVVVRLAVQRGHFRYEHVSGVGPDYIPGNLRDPLWPAQALFSLGIFLPFLALGWRRCPPAWRTLILFLLAALVGSNAVFSALREARNYVPATVLLAHLAAAVLLGEPEPSVREPPRPELT